MPVPLLLLAAASALAQPVSAVPAGAAAVTVFVCDRNDRCRTEYKALSAWTTSLGMPLLEMGDVAFEGPQGEQAKDRFLAALKELEASPSVEAAQDAREALKLYPFTAAPDDVFRIQLLLGVRLLEAGRAADGDRALAAAASSSGGRTFDLPPLSDKSLARYYDVVQDRVGKTGTLQISSPAAGARILVDGRPVGPSPAAVEVLPGWHRVTVERAGRRTAWVGEVEVLAGATLPVLARNDGDDGTGALTAAVLGAIRGEPAPSDIVDSLATWARASDLEWVRFVAMDPVVTGRGQDDVVVDPKGDRYALSSAWINVDRGRFVSRGPGNAVLRSGPKTARFRLGGGLGYLYLSPNHHVSWDVDFLYGLTPTLTADVRLGMVHSNQDYFLYTNWVDPWLFPVSGGLRYGRTTGGPYAGAALVAFVPYALGGLGRAGWELSPSTWWRVDLEATGGLTDKGWLAGGQVRVARRY